MMRFIREYFSSKLNGYLLLTLFIAPAWVASMPWSSRQSEAIVATFAALGVLNLLRLTTFALKHVQLGFQRLAIALMPTAATIVFVLLRESHFYRYSGFRETGDFIIGLVWMAVAAVIAGSVVVVTAWIADGFSN